MAMETGSSTAVLNQLQVAELKEESPHLLCQTGFGAWI